jgi:hypothetical protein
MGKIHGEDTWVDTWEDTCVKFKKKFDSIYFFFEFGYNIYVVAIQVAHINGICQMPVVLKRKTFEPTDSTINSPFTFTKNRTSIKADAGFTKYAELGEVFCKGKF